MDTLKLSDKPEEQKSPLDKQVLLVALAIVVMLAGIGAWIFFGHSSKPAIPPPAPSAVTEPAKPAPPPAAKPAENKPQAKTAKPAAKHQKKDRHVGKKKSRRRLA